MSIIFVSVYGQQERDDLCQRLSTVLCLKDTLLEISTATKQIIDITKKIQDNIYQRERNRISLEGYIHEKIEDIRSNIQSKHHYRYMHIKNNINRTELIDLIEEENYAYSYLYNSIQNILKLDNSFGKTVDKLFEKILHILRKDILCNYRNILYIYSKTWSRIDEIHGIQIFKNHKRNIPSFLHSSYSIIVVRLLEEWMQNVDYFVVNIDQKLQ